jgi:hypothetical protein
MSSYQIKAITPEEYRAWFERNYSSLHHRSPFHHPAWLESVCRGVRFGLRVAGAYQGSDLVVALPGFWTRQGPFGLFGSPLRGTMTSYLGPVSLAPIETKAEMLDLILQFNQFVRQQWKGTYNRFTLRDAPPDGLLEMETNWKQQRPRSYRLDLRRGEEALWKGLESDCRRNIRKAQNAGLEIVPVDDPHLFFSILDDTFRRHGTVSWHSERFFELAIGELIPRDLMWAWGAKHQGEIIAVGLFLHDDREMHFISGASLPKFGSFPTSYLLHWHAILTAAGAGLQVFNSDASRVRSIDQFKESFRPELERRYTFIWAPNQVQVAQKAFLSTFKYIRKMRSKFNPGLHYKSRETIES